MANVKLIACTAPYKELGMKDLVQFIAYCARVSNPGNQQNDGTSYKLLRYLIDHHHWSPFEMGSLCLEIKTTRDIGRQILRHRSFSFQEFSQRYAEVVGFDGVQREARLQDSKNRQNSLETDDQGLDELFKSRQVEQQFLASENYRWALSQGIAKEQARCFLPEGLTPTTMYMSGTLRSWIHYIQLRTDPSTQKEHRQVAEECSIAIAPVFPMIQEFVGGKNGSLES